jgi:hypothetical protein
MLISVREVLAIAAYLSTGSERRSRSRAHVESKDRGGTQRAAIGDAYEYCAAPGIDSVERC